MPEIVIFGGTTEGRMLAEILSNAEYKLYICVTTEYGASLLPKSPNIEVHTGCMDEKEMRDFLSGISADYCVDATHPYAQEATENIRKACSETGLRYIRVVRKEDEANPSRQATGELSKVVYHGSPRSQAQRAQADWVTSCMQRRLANPSRQATGELSKVVYHGSTTDAAAFLKETTGNILITTGSKELDAFTCIGNYRDRCFARVLPTVEVMEKCRELGFEGKNVVAMQGPFSEELNYWLMKQLDVKWLVTKNSGKAGGYQEKCEAAFRAGANIVIIGRPSERAKDCMSLEETVQFLKSRLPGVLFDSDLSLSGVETIGEIGTASAPSAVDQDSLNELCTCENKQSPEISELLSECPDGKFFLSAAGQGKKNVYFVSAGPGNQKLLTEEAREILADCDVLIGAQRMLEIGRVYTKAPCFQSYQREEIAAFLHENPQYRKAAVLYSGDIGFYSGAKGMGELLPEYETHFVSGISSAPYFLNRLGIPWDQVKLYSMHGRQGNLIPLIQHNHRVCVLLGGKGQLEEICEELQALHMNHVKIVTGERLSYPEERILSGYPSDMKTQDLDSLAVALFENLNAAEVRGIGIEDREFIRGKIPMTKQEIRILSLAKLNLNPDSVVYDIGAGTGSVSVEAALQCERGYVYAIEKKQEAVQLIIANQEKFQVSNLTVIKGMAPEILKELPVPTHAFIGGSGGQLPDIISAVRSKNPGTRFVLNAVTLETLAQLEEIRERFLEYADMEVAQVGVAKSRPLGNYHFLSAENPVYIVSFGG